MKTPINEYLLEGNFFQPVAALLNGTAHTTGVEFAVLLEGLRPVPADFHAAATLNGATGVMTGGRTVLGTYYGYYRVTDVNPETPWVPCGPIFRLV